MRIEKNINSILHLAKQKADENWQFRAFLKGCEQSDEEIDAMVHRLYNEVSKQIDCLECGNCCRKQSPVLSEKEIVRLAEYLKKTKEDFTAEYLKYDESERGYTFSNKPCLFLKGNACTLYDIRPDDCRSYPHLHKANFTSRLMNVVFNYEYCPIVFNVYEELKIELWKWPRHFSRR